MLGLFAFQSWVLIHFASTQRTSFRLFHSLPPRQLRQWICVRLACLACHAFPRDKTNETFQDLIPVCISKRFAKRKNSKSLGEIFRQISHVSASARHGAAWDNGNRNSKPNLDPREVLKIEMTRNGNLGPSISYIYRFWLRIVILPDSKDLALVHGPLVDACQQSDPVRH
ncbi:hypothetical protein B0T20DRAFT_61424 [Sordaria brevicollis]|uniref:Secreted protein n=1 Tax=Sordaria brevicollis TaxID=83679 RepID=A0AAE0P3J5_SORBR|nr:hypothetical protein B0T20DRAFT_61424 [Sordaria brevicollis]